MSEELTFVLTDVESSTALWERYPEQMSVALAHHEQIIGDAVAHHDGKLVRDRGEGDSMFAVFGSPIKAAAAAAEFSRALGEASWTEEAPLRVRVAVYTGEAEARDGDYYGTTINRAARVRSLAFGGQVLLGGKTAMAVVKDLPALTSLVDLGPRTLKDLSAPEHVFELRLEDATVLPEPLSDSDASNVLWMDRIMSSAFVDRVDERRALAVAWAAASAGERVLALLEGEPGIGKTALAAGMANHARNDGGLVLYGRWDEEFLAPFQAMREALGAYARACPRSILRADLHEHGEDIARLFPEVGERIDVGMTANGGAAEAERLRLFEAVGAWLEAIASRRPVLLVLDDLHWADRSSLLLLQNLLRAPSRARLFVIATFRGSEVERGDLADFLPTLTRDANARRLSLAGLGKSDVIDLVGHVTGRPLDDRAVALGELLHDDTGGNPLFLREMVQLLTDSDAMDADSLKRVDPPDSVRDLVRWRVRQLPEVARDGLSCASVIGQEFELEVLAQASGVDENRLADALDTTCRAGLVHEADVTGYRFAFSHAVVRRTLLDDLSGARRARLHWRVGEALENRRPSASPAELAHHFCAAVTQDRAAKAISYARSAGDQAMAELAFENAVRHFQKALEIQQAQRPEDGVLRCLLLLSLGDAHDKAGQYMERSARFVEAAESARKLKRADLFSRAALGYGGVLPAAAEADPQGEALLEDALHQLGNEDSRERAHLLGRLAHSLQLVPPRTRRVALAEEAVAIARRLGDPADLAAVLIYQSWAMDGPVDNADQLAAADEIRRLGEEIGDREIVLRSLHLQSDAHFEAGNVERLHSAVEELGSIAHELRYPEYTRIARSWGAVFAVIEGRFEEARTITDEVYETLKAMGHPQADLIRVGLVLPAEWLQGTIIDWLPIYEPLAEALPERLLFASIVAWCSAEGGMNDRALKALNGISHESVRELEQNFMWWGAIVGLTTATTLLGDREWADLLYECMSPFADRNATLGSSTYLGSASHHLGVLATTLQRWDEAEQHFEDALEKQKAMGARGFVALTQQCYAGTLLERGRPEDEERARSLADEAADTAGTLGLVAVQRRAEARSRA